MNTPDNIARIRQLLVRGSFSGMIVTLLVVVAGFFVEVVLARILGKEQYGIYVYVTTIIALLALTARAGTDMALMRFAPTYIGTGEWGLLRGIKRFTILFVATLSIAIGLLCIILAWAWRGFMAPELNASMLAAASLVPLLAIGGVYQSANRALKQVMFTHLPLNVVAPFLLILVLVTTHYLMGTEITAHLAVLMNVFSVLVGTLLAWTVCRRKWPIQARREPPTYRVREWINVAVTLLFINGMYLVINQTDTIMLGLLAGTDQSGLYNAAAKVSMFTAFPLLVTNIIVAPMISELHGTKKMQDLQYMLRSVVRMTSLATLVITIALLVSGEWILGLFGKDFPLAYTAMTLLIIGHAINSLSGASGHLLVQTGNHKVAAVIMGSCALANAVLNILLIPVFGMLGAALATAISMSALNVAMVVYARIAIGIDPSLLSLVHRRL